MTFGTTAISFYSRIPATIIGMIIFCLSCFGPEGKSQTPGQKKVAFVDGAKGALQTMVETTFEFKGTSQPKGGLETTWTVNSETSTGFDCSHLITSQSATSATLLLTGDGDARCADELILTHTRSKNGQQIESVMKIHIVPTPGRITNFVELPGNPQPAIQACPAWDCLNHTDPTLGMLPSGELAIWFSAGGDRSAGKPVVGRAVQKNTTQWVLDESPVMTAENAQPNHWDVGRETPSVKWNKTAKAWDMWYLGYRDGYHDDPAIGQARSLDPEGTRWERSEKPIYRPSKQSWDGTFLTSPGAVLGSDGIWRLYYVGANTTIDGEMRVGVLLSKDGMHWASYKNNPIFSGEQGKWDYNILDAHVQFVGGRYVMWYSALAGQLKKDIPISVGVAVSEDGFTWQRVREQPIIQSKKGWTSTNVLDVEVLPLANGSLFMAGYGHSNTPPNPAYPDFQPGRIGFWISTGIK